MKFSGKNHRIATAVGLLAFTGILTLFFYIKAVQTERIQSHFHETSREAHRAIQRELELTQESLAVIQSLFASRSAISRIEFQKLAASLISRHPTIQAVEWIPRVKGSERNTFEAALQKEGFREFGITRRLAEGTIAPDIERKEYFPVDYLEPVTGNEAALGYNLGSDPGRRKALEKARQTGRTTATEAIALAQETKQQKGFILLLPVYENGAKKNGLYGFVLAVLKVEALLPSSPDDAMAFSLSDVTDAKKELLVKQSAKSGEVGISDYDYTAPIAVADRVWQLHAWPSQAAIAQKGELTPYWFLISALSLFFTVVFLYLRQLRQSEKIRTLGEELADAEAISRTGRWKIDWQNQTVWMSGVMLDIYDLKESRLPLPVAVLLARIHPDDRETWQSRMESTLRDEALHTTEFRVQLEGGETNVILTQGKTVRSPDGRPRFVIGTALDVTKEREREKQVRFNESYLQVVFDTEPDILVTTDSTTIDRGNIRMLEFTGYPDIESFKKEHSCICDLFEKVPGYLQSDMGGISWLEYIYAHPGDLHQAIIHKEGTPHVFAVTANRLLLDEKKRSIVVLNDITELEAKNEALREEQLRTELYLQTAQVMLLALDPEGVITMINRRGCEILGYAKEEVIGKQWYTCCIPEASRDALKKIFSTCLEERPIAVREHENEILRKDGTTRLIHWRNAQLKNEAGEIIGVLGSGEDVTRQRQDEERLKLFRTLIDHAGEAVEVLEPSTLRLLDVNQTECRTLGYSREELLSMTVYDIDPEFTPERGEAAEAQLRQTGSLTFEGVHRRKDGSIFPVEVNVTLVELDRPYILSIARDITERHEAEQTLIQSKQKYKELVENINDWVWETDTEGRFTYLSPKARELLGYEPGELLGKTLFDQMPPDESARVRELFNEKVRAKAPILNLENTLIHKDGTPVIMETSGVPILDSRGNLTGYRGVDRDVTERKKSEAVLRHFMEMIDQSRDTIFLVNPEGRFVDVNQEACRSLGYTREELLTMGVLDIAPDRPGRPPLAELIPMILEQGSMTFEAGHIRKDGSEMPVELSVTAEKGSQEGMLIAVARDITERKAMEKELHRKEELMIAQSRQAAMGDMIAMIAHQWRQPITVIAMAANNIKLGIELEEEVTTEALRNMTDTVTEQTQHLSKTIDDFRNFFKPNKERQYVTLCKVLGDTLGIVGKSLENNNIRLELPQACRREIFTFPNELLQVFLNIIGNAKDALKKSKTADAVIRITVLEGDAEVRAVICDNGGGIPANVIGRMGEPYFTTKKEGGTGLGLYMSKTIVEKHLHGTLSWENVQKEKGTGACFTVTLPIRPKEETAQ